MLRTHANLSSAIATLDEAVEHLQTYAAILSDACTHDADDERCRCVYQATLVESAADGLESLLVGVRRLDLDRHFDDDAATVAAWLDDITDWR
jgi:hypothetical protein